MVGVVCVRDNMCTQNLIGKRLKLNIKQKIYYTLIHIIKYRYEFDKWSIHLVSSIYIRFHFHWNSPFVLYTHTNTYMYMYVLLFIWMPHKIFKRFRENVCGRKIHCCTQICIHNKQQSICPVYKLCVTIWYGIWIRINNPKNGDLTCIQYCIICR